MEDPANDRSQTIFLWLAIFNIIAYSVLLILDGYMVIKYLVIEKKHELTYMIPYYALTFALALSKICMFIVILRYTGD